MANSKNNNSKNTNTKNTGKGSKSSGSKKSTAKSTKTTRKAGASATKATSGKREYTAEERERMARREGVRRQIKSETVLIITFVVAVLLFLSNFSMSGKVGAAVRGFLFGSFGFIAYLFPLLLLLSVAFYLANRDSFITSLRAKIISAVCIFILFCAMFQLGTGVTNTKFTPVDYYKASVDSHAGGGFVGGVLCYFLVPLFGQIGTYIILAALEIIFLMIITGKAFITIIRKFMMEKGREFKEHEAERKELRLEQRRAYEELAQKEKENYLRNPNAKNPAGESQQGFFDMFFSKDLGDVSKVEEKEEVKPSKNFFGGITPTTPVTFKNPDGNQYEADPKSPDGMYEIVSSGDSSEQTGRTEKNEYQEQGNSAARTINIIDSNRPEAKETTPYSVYEEELKNKFDGKEYKPETATKIPAFLDKDIKRTTGKKTPDILIDTESADKPMSFSERSLSDRRMQEEASPMTIFDEAPYSVTNRTVKKKENESNSSEVTNKTENDSKKRTEKVITKENISPDKNNQMTMEPVEVVKEYKFPPIDLLKAPKPMRAGGGQQEMAETAAILESTLNSFGVKVQVTDVTRGPSVTRYELKPDVGVKVSRVTGLADDIKLALAAADIRIEAPIPGKAAIGIEVPNQESVAVLLRDLIESKEFTESKGKLPFAVGKSIEGANIIGDIAKMPHMLIAGQTGSGKSVCINTIVMSILYKLKPEDVKIIMIDPKVVELSVYNGIPHLLIPVVTDPKKAAASLNWAVQEMEDRYSKFADLSVRDLAGYNQRIKEEMEKGHVEEKFPLMSHMIIIVDEMADLMMVAASEVEEAICRLAQKARACGIHLILATQRPSVNVITGLIKANVPSRIAFSVASGIDSRTILDSVGAEKLLGKGDMLYFPTGYTKPVRVQGAFVSDEEVNSVVAFLKSENDEVSYNGEITKHIEENAVSTKSASGKEAAPKIGDADKDELFGGMGRTIIESQKASIGMLQRHFKVGFNRAARTMDQLADAGVVSKEDGTKPRTILMTMDEFEAYLQGSNEQ